MNILYYIPNLSQKWGGVRQYAKGVLEIIAKETGNKYFVYHNNGDPEIMEVLIQNPQLKLIKDNDVSYSKLNEYWQKSIRYLNIFLAKINLRGSLKVHTFIDALCEQYFIDIIHCPYQFTPITKKAKLITTMHDVQELHFPEFFTSQARAFRAVNHIDYLSIADKVIVSYDHVKTDLIKYFQIPENEIEILLIKMNDLWVNHFSEEKIIDVKDITGDSDFLLYPANTWKHKNHLRLVEAIGLLRDKFNLNVKIICTGDKTEHFEDINNLVKKLNLENYIIFTDVVSEQTLYSLYKSCRAVVVPSLYEAGSFPLYESILLNIPVICSNVTSLPETIDNEECLFNPFITEDIASKIKDVWTDNEFRNRIKEHLKIASKRISNNNPLPILQTIYLSLIKLN